MMYFVLAYDPRRGELIERHDFPTTDRESARTERDRLAMKHAADPDVEVVLLGSKSEADLRATHGRYFERDLPTSLAS